MRRRIFAGLPIVVENPAGSLRRWHDADGKQIGATRMLFDYGYIEGTTGQDGDEVDCYLGPNESSTLVYVVDQLKKPEYVEFDERKCFLGFDSAEDVTAAFIAHRDDGDRAIGGVTSYGIDEFKKTLRRSEAFSMQPRLFSVPAFRFAIVDPMSAIGKWSRVATFGPKAKDGARMVFDATTLGQMVDNAAARGDRIAICNDHASAYPETRDAPALGFFYALAVVAGGRVVKHWAMDGGAKPDASTMEDGLYARLGEVTPRGADPIVGLANYRTLSPMFTENGKGENDEDIGFSLFDVAATNVPFQGGAEIMFHGAPVTHAMARESRGHIAWLDNGMREAYDQSGEVYIAPANAPIDLDGYRQGGRWECSRGLWDRSIGKQYKTSPSSAFAALTMAAWDLHPKVGSRVLSGSLTGEVARIDGDNFIVHWDNGSTATCDDDAIERGVVRVTRFGHEGAQTMAYASKIGDEGTLSGGDMPGGKYDPFLSGERVRVTAISDSGRLAKVVSVNRPGVSGQVPIAAVSMSAPRAMTSVAVRQVIGNDGKPSGAWYVTNPNGGMPAFQTKEQAIEWVRKNGWTPDVMMSTGAARAFGEKTMDTELMQKMGLADGAPIGDKMAKYSAHAMGEASDDEIKAMADDLDASDDEKAKSMAAKFRRMAGPVSDDPVAMDQTHPINTAKGQAQNAAIHIKTGNVNDEGGRKHSRMSAADDPRIVAMNATIEALNAKVGYLQAEAADRARQAEANRNAEIEQMVADAVAGGYPAAHRADLVRFARADFDAALGTVQPFLKSSANLFSRTPRTAAGRSNAVADAVEKNVNGVRVVKFGNQLAAAAKARATADKISYDRALDLVVAEKPELYEAVINARR